MYRAIRSFLDESVQLSSFLGSKCATVVIFRSLEVARQIQPDPANFGSVEYSTLTIENLCGKELRREPPHSSWLPAWLAQLAFFADWGLALR